jgi:hypothetical protein
MAADEHGQATIEWTGLVLLIALAALGLASAGIRLPGPSLAGQLMQRLLCAAGLEAGACIDAGPRLVSAYGPEVAARVSEHAPRVEYEDGMRALPVDFRQCRTDRCAEGAESGRALRSLAGRPVTLFSHVIDCRPGALADARRPGYECSGERRGRLYVQLWAYYPGSATGEGSIAPGAVRAVSSVIGRPSYHDDDWESYQLRLGGGAGEARASSHNGYNYTAGPSSWPSDLGIASRAAWGQDRGRYYISGGSHAGHAFQEPGLISQLRRRLAGALADSGLAERVHPGAPGGRWTPPSGVRIVPLEPLVSRADHAWQFAITPPWRKRVYRDPEYEGTD